MILHCIMVRLNCKSNEHLWFRNIVFNKGIMVVAAWQIYEILNGVYCIKKHGLKKKKWQFNSLKYLYRNVTPLPSSRPSYIIINIQRDCNASLKLKTRQISTYILAIMLCIVRRITLGFICKKEKVDNIYLSLQLIFIFWHDWIKSKWWFLKTSGIHCNRTFHVSVSL